MRGGLQRGAATEKQEALGAGAGPGGEFVEQPALAHAGFAHHVHRGEAALPEQLLVGRQQGLELGIAADHARGHAFDAARGHAEVARLGTLHQVGLHRQRRALHGQRRLGFHVEEAAHMGIGLGADAQGTGRRALLHAGGQVHRFAGERVVRFEAGAQHHLARVRAQAQAELGHALRLLQVLGVFAAGCDDVQAGQHRLLGVVFARALGAEAGLQAVARVAQHLSAAGAYAGGGAFEHGAEGLQHVFRVQAAGQGGGADDVDEEHGDLCAPQLRRRTGARACLA